MQHDGHKCLSSNAICFFIGGMGVQTVRLCYHLQEDLHWGKNVTPPASQHASIFCYVLGGCSAEKSLTFFAS